LDYLLEKLLVPRNGKRLLENAKRRTKKEMESRK
jgi:hypothetical protein